MKRYILILAAIMVLATACQKDDITPLPASPSQDITDCKICDGSWDLTDTIP